MTEHRYRVFDTGPLSAFANSDVLGVLGLLCDGYESVLLDEVAVELRGGVHLHPRLIHVLEAGWLQQRALESDAELRNFAEVGELLIGRGNRNVGETAVIAWAQANDQSQVVIDDGVARKVAHARGLDVIGSLGLVIDAVNAQHLSAEWGSRVVDGLIGQGRARFPFGIGGFVDWAQLHGHL